MQVPLQITFLDIDPSPFIEEKIIKKAVKLEQFSDRIIGCQVVVESPQRHHQHGKLYNVRVHLTLPRKELLINRNEHTNIYVAIRNAFSDAKRKLEEETNISHGEVKNHPPLMQGKIARLFPEGFGFIEDEFGEEFYFNSANVVHPAFAKLQVGNSVHFIEACGDEGLQAHRVTARTD